MRDERMYFCTAIVLCRFATSLTSFTLPVESSTPKVHISSDDNEESTSPQREKDSWGL